MKLDIPGNITIVGAGHVGSHCAMALAVAGVGSQIVLVDKDAAKARSQALDVADALAYRDGAPVVRSGTYADCADADIVVIAIGEPRLPGQTRLDLLDRSVVLVSELLDALAPYPPRGLVVTITNPADVVADLVRRGLKLPRTRAFGTGTLLDTARLTRLLAERTGRPKAAIHALALGEHGDSSMIPFSQVLVDEESLENWSQADKDDVVKKTRAAGMEIIEGKGSTEFGIGQALTRLCAAVLDDVKTVMPLSVLLEGEYGQKGIHCGVPCQVGRDGIEQILELMLSPAEWQQLTESCGVIRTHTQRAYASHPSLRSLL